jgi:hypothetical protein
MRIISTNLGQGISNELAKEIEESFKQNKDIDLLDQKTSNNNNNNKYKNQNQYQKEFFKTSIDQKIKNKNNNINKEKSPLRIRQSISNISEIFTNTNINNNINNNANTNTNKKSQLNSMSIDFLNNKDIDLDLDLLSLTNQKKIRIKQKKIIIPESSIEKYNNDENYGSILPNFNLSQLEDVHIYQKENQNQNQNKYLYKNKSFNNFNNYYEKNKSPIKNIDNNNSININNKNQEYSFKEIIKISAQNNLRRKFQVEDELKKMEFRLNENNFRSDYIKDKPKTESLHEILNNKIENKHISLIKYINSKDNISEVFLKKLKESDTNQMTKFNKICPIVFQKQKREELFNKNIKEKILEKHTSDAIKLKTDLENIDKRFNENSKIFKEYEKFLNEDKLEKYGDSKVFYEDNYWDKFQVDKFLFKNKIDYKNCLLNYEEKDLKKKYYI